MPDDSNRLLERDSFLASHPPRIVSRSVIRKAMAGHEFRGTVAVGMITLGLGLWVSLFVFPRNLMNEWRLRSGTAETVGGLIVSSEKSRGAINSSPIWKHGFAFRSHDGQMREGSAYLTGEAWENGTEVDVLYLKEKPWSAMAVGSRMDESPALGVLVLLAPLWSLRLIWRALAMRATVFNLLRNGVLARARVERVQATRKRVAGQTVYEITLTRAKDGLSILWPTWDEREVAAAYRKLEHAEPLWVLQGPGKPERLLAPEAWDLKPGISPEQFVREFPEAGTIADGAGRRPLWEPFLAQAKPRRIPRWFRKERTREKGFWSNQVFGILFLAFGLFLCGMMLYGGLPGKKAFTPSALLVLLFPAIGCLIVIGPWLTWQRRVLRWGNHGKARVEGIGVAPAQGKQPPEYAIYLVLEDGTKAVHQTPRLQDAAFAARKEQAAEPVGILYDPLKPTRVVMMDV